MLTSMKRTFVARARSAVSLSALAIFLGSAVHPAQAAENKKTMLMEHFSPLMAGFGNKNTDKAKVLSGPEEVKMLRGQSPGKMWRVSLGDRKFKLTIEDQVTLDATNCLRRLERIPAAYRHAFEIVSEDKKDGVAFYKSLDGAAAHGSQDYLNVVPDADARVVAHECGHVLEQRVTRSQPKTLENWKQAIASDKVSVSTYGDQVAHEDLAEFALVYALCLDAGKNRMDELKKLSPQRFQIWENILKVSRVRSDKSPAMKTERPPLK